MASKAMPRTRPQRRQAKDCQRTKAKRVKRKEWKRNSVVVLTKSERVLIRVEDRRVEKVQRVMNGLVIIPPGEIGVKVRISFVGNRITQMQDPGPCHDGG